MVRCDICLLLLLSLFQTSVGLVRIFKLIPNRETILRDSCYSQGGQLAVVYNAETQNQALEAAVTQSPTRYLRVRLGAEIFQKDEGFTWVDGGRMTYSNWAFRQPDNFNNRSEKCLEMIIEPGEQQGKWNDQICDVIPMALCEQTSKHKYRIFPNRMDSLGPLCYANGGILAEIHSRADQELALRVAVGSRSLGQRKLRIGARLAAPMHAHRRKQRLFVWPREVIMSYTYWAPEEPNNQKQNESCVELQLDQYARWNDVNCKEPYLAICKIPSRINTLKLVRNTPSGIQQNCLDQGGRLMIIRSSDDQKAATALIRANYERVKGQGNAVANDAKVNYQRVLLGARRMDAFRCPEHRFAWVIEEIPVTYTNWDEHQPSGHDKEECVEMKAYGAGDWNDVECGKPSLALCQYPEKPEPYKTYQVIHEDGNSGYRSFDFWEQQCRYRGGLFAKINNETEQQLAEKAVRRLRLDNEIVLMGATQTSYWPRHFQWLDGSRLIYSRWTSEVRDPDLDCITLVTSGPNLGKWRVTDCLAAKALCEFIRRD